MLCAEVAVGGLVVALIQPLEGTSIYTEWLDSKGEGLHHILVGWAGDYAPDSDDGSPCGETSLVHLEERSILVQSRLQKDGIGVLMSGKVGEHSQFYYLDTQPVLKLIVESGGALARDLQPIDRFP
jgi:methylmalonyl-CoA/ethylmalonyl-CoA epimerase